MKLNELEIKIELGTQELFERVFEDCMRLFGPPASHTIQLDEYFDTVDGQLRKEDLVIRIRSTGGQQTIALKSPRVHLPSGTTSRIELEFMAADGQNVEEQLKRQGLEAYEAAEKERWTFLHKDFEIILDKLPFIGLFIEIEGPSEGAIQEMVSVLKLSSCKVIRQHYGELMTEKLRSLNLLASKNRATFAEEARHLANKF